MTSDHRMRVAACLLGVVGAAAQVSPAFASAFMLREQTPDLTGNAFVGGAAKAYDASTVFSNPAGMVRLDQNEFDAAVSGIFPHASFSGENFMGPGVTTSGTTGSNAVSPAAIGSNAGVIGITPDLKLGLSVTTPFGQRVSYPGDFVGRYHGLVTSVTDIAVSLALAYRINDHWSVGGGPIIDYFHARVTSALNLGPLDAFGNTVGDARGDDFGVGYNLGILYQYDEHTRIGLDYRSRIRHTISGKQSISVPGELAGAVPGVASALSNLNSDIKAGVTLPDNLALSFYHDLTPRLAVMADLQWTHWAVFNQIGIVPTNGSPTTTLSENWHDTIFAGIGANYKLRDNLVLQSGFAYDQSPVTDGNRNARIPDKSRLDLGIGAAYDVIPGVRLALAYLHAFPTGKANINNVSNSTSGQLVGHYDDHADIVSAGITVKF